MVGCSAAVLRRRRWVGVVVMHGIVRGCGVGVVLGCGVGGCGLWWRGFGVVGRVSGVELRRGAGGCIVF